MFASFFAHKTRTCFDPKKKRLFDPKTLNPPTSPERRACPIRAFLSKTFYQLSSNRAFTFQTNQPSQPNHPSINESIRPSKDQCTDPSISFGQAHRCLVVTDEKGQPASPRIWCLQVFRYRAQALYINSLSPLANYTKHKALLAHCQENTIFVMLCGFVLPICLSW